MGTWMKATEMLKRENELRADSDRNEKRRLTLPLWLEVLLCVLPLVIANIAIQHVVLERSISKNELSQYRVIMENVVNAFGARLIYSSSTDVDLADILEKRGSMVVPVSEQDTAAGYTDAQGHAAGTIYYRIYIYADDGTLLQYIPEDESVLYGDELYDRELKSVRAAMDADGVIFRKMKQEGTDYLAAYLAVSCTGKNLSFADMSMEDTDGSEIKVIFSCIVDTDAITDIQHGDVMQTSNILASSLLVMLAILAVILRRELSSLKLMRDTMDRIRDAELNGQSQEYEGEPIGRRFEESEISDLINVFNRMAGNIRVSLRRTRRLTDMFEPFVPEKLLRLFGKDDIRSLKPGDYTEVTGDLAYIRFRDAAGKEQRTELMNEMSGILTDALGQDGGMILNFDAETMIILFPEGCGMKHTVEAYTGWIAGREQDPGTVLCVDHRSLTVKLIGSTERMQLYIDDDDLSGVRCAYHTAPAGEHGPVFIH